MAGQSPLPQSRSVPDPDLVAEREPARQPERVRARAYVPPQPHEKYFIHPDDIPQGMDAMWLPTSIAGMKNPKIKEYYQAGWQPAAAKDFPDVSGYGIEFPQSMIDAGLLENVKADAVIVVDEQMLVMRQKHLSVQAHQRREQEAQDQLSTQMSHLKQTSSQYRDTQIRRRFAPMPDQSEE